MRHSLVVGKPHCGQEGYLIADYRSRERVPTELTLDSSGATAELEEGRRQLYVAITPADHLVRVVSQRLYVHQLGGGGDHHLYASRMRFIPEAVAGRLERGSWR